jgi:hypothetical protein
MPGLMAKDGQGFDTHVAHVTTHVVSFSFEILMWTCYKLGNITMQALAETRGRYLDASLMWGIACARPPSKPLIDQCHSLESP